MSRRKQCSYNVSSARLNPKLLTHRDESTRLCEKFLEASEEGQFRRILFATQDNCLSMASGKFLLRHFSSFVVDFIGIMT